MGQDVSADDAAGGAKGSLDASRVGFEPETAETVVERLHCALRVQSLVAVGLAGVLLLLNPVAAYSSLFGSLSAYLPGLLGTLLTARRIGDDSARFLRTAMLAEFAKLGGVAVSCGLVFVFVKPLAPGYFFLGMITMLAANWLGLGLAFSAPNRRR